MAAMHHDLAWLDTEHDVSMWLGFKADHNPFLVPPATVRAAQCCMVLHVLYVARVLNSVRVLLLVVPLDSSSVAPEHAATRHIVLPRGMSSPAPWVAAAGPGRPRAGRDEVRRHRGGSRTRCGTQGGMAQGGKQDKMRYHCPLCAPPHLTCSCRYHSKMSRDTRLRASEVPLHLWVPHLWPSCPSTGSGVWACDGGIWACDPIILSSGLHPWPSLAQHDRPTLMLPLPCMSHHRAAPCGTEACRHSPMPHVTHHRQALVIVKSSVHRAAERKALGGSESRFRRWASCILLIPLPCP